MHHYFLLEIIDLFDPQLHWIRWLRPFNVERLNVQTPRSSIVATFYSYSYLYNLLQKYCKSQKYF